MHERLLSGLDSTGDHPAVRIADQGLSHRELAAAAEAVANSLTGRRRVAIWATSTLETVVGVVAALLAGVPVVPINPKSGERELTHILTDSDPDLLLSAANVDLPAATASRERLIVVCHPPATPGAATRPEPPAESPAVIVYTSGTTGPPKGVLLSRAAIAGNLDALARAWQWTGDDVVTHALPLFHVHGLILGVLGPLRLGGTVHHLGTFSSAAVAEALHGLATMLFGVPTMYHRLAADASVDPTLAAALAKARLLVSGSAALAAVDHERIAKATGQRVVERYGMSETLMNCAVRADGERRAGTVGPPLDGVQVRLVDDDGVTITVSDDATIGEIVVRGPNLFLGYLNRPDATADAVRDGWFHTGDLATRAADGYLRIVGRRATDLIKSGGFKIGAGEIENVLLEHPGVAEAAVTGAPDPDLGERVVAWIVPAEGHRPEPQELADRVAATLAPHKRPREFHFLAALPRNELGKVLKRELGLFGRAVSRSRTTTMSGAIAARASGRDDMDPARLHPQARIALGVHERTPLTLDNFGAARDGMRDAAPTEVGPGPRLREVVDIDADGVATRLYRDNVETPSPVVVYTHGGGWVLGDLETHDGFCRRLAAETGWAVLAVDYRRAPESPYPAAVDDVARVLSWLREIGGSAYGIDPARIALAGDSAGGHLATVSARRARDAGHPVVAQVLICPVVDPAMDYPKLDDYGLHRDDMRFFWDAFVPPGIDRDHPDINPLLADLTGLPPTLVITAELDVLGDEAELYASRLMQAGVPIVCARYQGLIHNFPRKPALFDAASDVVAQIAATLRRF